MSFQKLMPFRLLESDLQMGLSQATYEIEMKFDLGNSHPASSSYDLGYRLGTMLLTVPRTSSSRERLPFLSRSKVRKACRATACCLVTAWFSSWSSQRKPSINHNQPHPHISHIHTTYGKIEWLNMLNHVKPMFEDIWCFNNHQPVDCGAQLNADWPHWSVSAARHPSAWPPSVPGTDRPKLSKLA